MKIRSLTIEQRTNFKKNCPVFLEFLKNTAPKLSKCSHKLYSRALSFIAVENDMINLTPKQLAMKLSKEVLTQSNFESIVGNDTTGNQNIRLSAFRNLVEPFKDDLEEEVSCVSYKTLNNLLSKKGSHIRKQISERKKDEDKNMDKVFKEKNNWKKCQMITINHNQKYDVIFNRFLKTNEVPDYITLRDAVIANLYCNNIHKFQNLSVYVILHNEYKTCHLWISHEQPPEDKTNYFWINTLTQNHFIVIQKSGTVGGVRRVPDKNGGTKVIPNEPIKMFRLSKKIAAQILFIKTTFNERCDRPFFKNDLRDGPINDQKWQRIMNKLFHTISTTATCKTIRKILESEIDWSKLNEEQSHYLMSCLDVNSKKKKIGDDGILDFS